MNFDIESHPGIAHQQDMAALCAPLERLGITYFSHVTVKHGQFTGIGNHPEFHRFYIKNKYYNSDLHTENQIIHGEFLLVDDLNLRGKARELNQAAVEMGINNVFTIFDTTQHAQNFYYFATTARDKSFNQKYLSNVDILKAFIKYFHHNMSLTPALQKVYDHKYQLKLSQTPQLYYRNKAELQLRAQLLNELSVLQNNKCLLTTRQLEILYWLHNGKTISDISEILKLAEITINKHISELKRRTGCYTQFQLGEFYAKHIRITAQDPRSHLEHTKLHSDHS